MLEKVSSQSSGDWSLGESDFAPEKVGRKSLNLSKLRGKLPDWLHVPACVTLPFGIFERTLADPSNKQVAAKLQATLDKLSKLQAEAAPPMAQVSAALEEARAIVATGGHRFEQPHDFALLLVFEAW